MTIALTEPLEFTPGHGGPTETLAEVKVVDFHVSISEAWLSMRTEYGNTVNGVWVPGSAAGREVMIIDKPAQIDPYNPNNTLPADPAYSILVGTTLTTAADVLLYGEVSAGLYQYLIDNEPGYAGTITGT